MNSHSFWQKKIDQYLDHFKATPLRFQSDVEQNDAGPDKAGPDDGDLDNGDQERLSLGGESQNSIPARIAMGADRPVLPPRLGEQNPLQSNFFTHMPYATHPLSNHQLPLLVKTEKKRVDPELAKTLEEQWNNMDSLPSGSNMSDAKKHFFSLWRCAPDEMRKLSPNWVWEFMPADARCPDHAVWEHNRIKSALAFARQPLDNSRTQAPETPWLFSFALQPVQDFLKQARKSQDLWIGSMLIAELSWAAMESVIEQYGPDTIVYPDLRGNPRADVWFYKKNKYHLPATISRGRGPSTRAAIVPHTFIAMVPRGPKKEEESSIKEEESPLIPLNELGKKTRDAVQKKWETISKDVQKWMEKELSGDYPGLSQSKTWTELWKYAHITCPLTPTWVAIPWPGIVSQSKYHFSGNALPSQHQDRIPIPDKKDQKIIDERNILLGKWLPKDIWDRYEYTLSVYGRSDPGIRDWGGFSYAPAHHKLKICHSLRKRAARLPKPSPSEASYEKCTLCHTRDALSDYDKTDNDKGNSIRNRIKEFWSHEKLDPEKTGRERLCPACALRRFLVKSESSDFNEVWAGAKQQNTGKKRLFREEKKQDNDGKLRTPFPSTVFLAAQDYLAQLAEDFSSYQTQAEKIIQLHNALGINKSNFPRSLPRMIHILNSHPEAKTFLQLDPQLALFPEMVNSAAISRLDQIPKRDNERHDREKKIWQDLQKTVSELRKTTDTNNVDHRKKSPNQGSQKAIGSPRTRLAVLVMDGDEMGKLVLGDPNRVKALWKDILSPETVNAIRGDEKAVKTGWPELFNLPRTTGPAIQAFISRCLADFSHHMVPWVIEQEFSGRLIYAGGDDLMALMPADDALKAAARIQSLFSAPWVVDTQPDRRPWSWFENQNSSHSPPSHSLWDPSNAKKRFKAIHTFSDRVAPEHRIIPMLGESGSISAGIMYGHFKTRMGLLLENAHTMLELFAKEKSGRNSIGIGHFSRSGPKTRFAIPWKSPSVFPQEPTDHIQQITKVIEGFQSDKIASTLPYKLKEYIQVVDPIHAISDKTHKSDPSLRKNLLRGFLVKALENSNKVDKELREALLSLWEAGYKLSHPNPKLHPNFCREPLDEKIDPLAGLFLCRHLAGQTEEL
ncbi:MAG: type III-B CRISPR-associated protein Cas10/Cmr2 [Desulfobacterium sp.]